MIAAGEQGQAFVTDVPDTAIQVEIKMVGEVHHCGLVGGAFVIQDQRVIGPNRIGDRHRDIAGKAASAVRFLDGEGEAGLRSIVRNRVPHPLLKSVTAAVLDVSPRCLGH